MRQSIDGRGALLCLVRKYFMSLSGMKSTSESEQVAVNRNGPINTPTNIARTVYSGLNVVLRGSTLSFSTISNKIKNLNVEKTYN